MEIFPRLRSPVSLFLLLASLATFIYLYLASLEGLPGHAFYDDEQMSFVSFSRGAPSVIGTRFRCSLLPLLRSLGLSNDFHYPRRPFRPEDVVFISYASSNHFSEARASLVSLRNLTANRIIFYDLGLHPNEIKELSAVCNIEIRSFNFDRYPAFVRRLNAFHFKSIIIADVFASLEAFWMIDSSVRFFGDLRPFYAMVASGVAEPLANWHDAQHSVYATTHPAMYSFLPIDPTHAKRSEKLEPGTMFIQRSDFAKEAVKWHLLCGLTEECISPKGANLYCSFGKDKYNDYANCHRYDQSAINLIMSSLLIRDNIVSGRLGKDGFDNFTLVERGRILKGPLRIPCDERIDRA